MGGGKENGEGKGMDTKTKVLMWLAGEDTGISSKVIAFHMVNIPLTEREFYWPNTPSDPSDFGRCLRLIEKIPEFRPRLWELATISEKWEILVNHWDAIEKSFIDEVGLHWEKSKDAPKTYALMTSLGL
jgi:hypothetical protein